MRSPKLVFVSYGNDKYKKSLTRIKKEAVLSNFFDYVETYTPEQLDPVFKDKFADVLSLSRIGGYGIWRPHLLRRRVSCMNEGDILVYLDAGCTINSNGVNRFKEYINMLNTSDKCVISFQLTHPEYKWTTKEIFSYFNITYDSEIALSGQYLDGILIMRKCANLEDLLCLWEQAVYDNVWMFTDKYNHNQRSEFIDNRHEQSVFSVLRKIKKYNIVLKDETYFKNFNSNTAKKYPFWATRIC